MPKETSVKPSRITPKKIIEFKDSGIHGMGGFALCKIRKGTPLIEYVGERITKAEAAVRCEENNPFIFSLNDEVDVDGNVSWNAAKYLNHSCEPNAEAEIFGEQIWIMAIRDIKAEEEITFNYSYDLENFEDHPCRCGAAGCVGYMVAEEYFPNVGRDVNSGDRLAKRST